MMRRIGATGVVGVGLLCLALAGCGSDSSDGSSSSTGGDGTGKATGEGPCESAGECANDVCVALIDGNNPPIYCSQTCGECPSGFYCDDSTFALAGISFCRFGATEPAAAETPPEEPPRLPCSSDGDCQGSLVCATFKGARDCTITCSAEDDCTPPAVGGVTIDLATCGQDETEGQDRTVCVPDMACFPNATSCISGVPGLPGLP